MIYIANAFSASMLSAGEEHTVLFTPLSDYYARRLCQDPGDEITSIVGHESTASVFANILGIEVPVNRTSVNIREGHHLLLGQYFGPRLPEGAIELPEKASIQWWLVRIKSPEMGD